MATTIALSKAQHILLKRIPALTTPSDIRRMLIRYKAQGVADVAIMYENFVPTKQALITLTRPNYLRDNLRELINATLSGVVFTSEEVDYSISGPPPSVFGTGPHAGVDNIGKNVVLSPFPSGTSPYILEDVLKKYTLVGSYQDSVLPINAGSKNPITMLVKLGSESEAYRVVRDLHMRNPLENVRWSRNLQARIIH
ncbi:hypothetical protein F5879DRAFT_646462 [Lentinula edodes]|uniref:uncharacterized protein n=1 Tax=Lentinula edodes TaxID=5353 RepID=UPI001E8EB031|nr:uncharacterized protein C8R40DRAFT_898629 [Lentinula edodes]KAH7877486.1 hypothetical protein C8R40DRAFT_898629 [Lentinula edodes]KAJ3906435.1 hypothetical protein F5879DRAFT_646462 [Lentinula edodes]